MVNPQKSNLVPSQVVQYLGVIINTTSFRASPSHLQAPVNRRRISVLRLASRELMALAAGRTFFAGSPRSWRQIADEISPALPTPILGSSGSQGSGVCVGGVSPRPPVVAPPSLPVFKSVSLPGVS